MSKQYKPDPMHDEMEKYLYNEFLRQQERKYMNERDWKPVNKPGFPTGGNDAINGERAIPLEESIQ